MPSWVQCTIEVLVVLAAAGLCLVGVALSCISISGTWLVAGAAVLLAITKMEIGVGWWTVLSFFLISILVEVVEAVAGAWGVRAVGGSRWSAVAAIVGGVLGLFVGGVIPPPVLGSLLGMFLGSFALVFIVEVQRVKKATIAARVAWGSLMGRTAVLLLKVVVTLCMVGYLIIVGIF